MTIKDLEYYFIVPDEEIILNKSLAVRGRMAMLLSITRNGEERTVWVLYHSGKGMWNEMAAPVRRSLTNRQELKRDMEIRQGYEPVFIRELDIQGEKFRVASSTNIHFGEDNYEMYAKLQHFMEAGIDLSPWYEVPADEISLLSCQLDLQCPWDRIDMEKPLGLSVTVEAEFRRVMVNKGFRIPFGEDLSGRKYTFKSGGDGKEHSFYIDKLVHYDIWKEAQERFDDPACREHLKEEEIRQMKEEYIERLPELCPEGMDLAVIEYETVEGMQLQFYTKEYLRQKVEHKGSAAVLMLMPDKKPGNRGYRNYACILAPIEKEYTDPVGVELFCCYLPIPEERIEVS